MKTHCELFKTDLPVCTSERVTCDTFLSFATNVVPYPSSLSPRFEHQKKNVSEQDPGGIYSFKMLDTPAQIQIYPSLFEFNV